MKPRHIMPVVAFAAVLGVHVLWNLHAHSTGPWLSVAADQGEAGYSYVGSPEMWLGLSYATAAAFAAFCLSRFYENRRLAVAGATGGLALTGFLYAAGCFLLGCCGSPMLAVYLGLFGPRFLGVTGPLVFGITLVSVAVGYVCVIRKGRAACSCEGGSTNGPDGAAACCASDGADAKASDAKPGTAAMRVLVESMQRAAAADKCSACGCAHDLPRSVELRIPPRDRPADLQAALDVLSAHLTDVEYDCRGCSECYGAIGTNALDALGEGAVGEEGPAPEARAGWPPLAGDYHLLRYAAPVAVCTLTDADLAGKLAARAGPEVSLVGTLQTENLGIERVIANVVSNVNIRFLILCGPDSRGQVGHLPGQSFLSLARSGIDEDGRIIGAPGRRPVLRNVSRDAVEHFRRNVDVIDLVGVADASAVLERARQCAHRSPGPAERFTEARAVEVVRGRSPERMTPDPKGYFVIFVDGRQGTLGLEHFTTEGALDCVIEGQGAAELYSSAIERKLVGRLDHAAYLGRELARAEHALRAGDRYVQDAAPGCDSECRR